MRLNNHNAPPYLAYKSTAIICFLHVCSM